MIDTAPWAKKTTKGYYLSGSHNLPRGPTDVLQPVCLRKQENYKVDALCFQQTQARMSASETLTKYMQIYAPGPKTPETCWK